MTDADSTEATVGADGSLKAGDRIDDRYLVERWLGGGGFSSVYLARDQNLDGMHVVVKVPKLGGPEDPTVLKKFRQEGEALSKIRHDGVVKVLGRGSLHDERPYMILEYVEGETLRRLMSSGPLDLTTAAELMRQLGSALNAAHEKQIFHRDLKPENILVHRRSDGRLVAKLIDFGIAKVADSSVTQDNRTAKFWGTPRYMSPEHFDGAELTSASDVYSLGVIAYEMLTGRRLSMPGSPGERVHAFGQEDALHAEPGRTLPHAAQEAIQKALEPDPLRRYQNASDFGEALGEALSAPRDEPRQGRVAALLPALIVCGLLISVGIWWAASYFRRPGVGSGGPPEVAQRDLRYYLTVQKMRGGRPYQEPFRSSGREIFESDYTFTFHLSSPDDGYFYLFSEGAADDGAVHFNILYPTPRRNSGSARVGRSQEIVTGENSFGGRPGTEKLWLVWTKEQLPELEAAKAAAFKGDGRVGDASQERSLRAFLNEHSAGAESAKDVPSKETVIKGVGDVVVSVQYLEHR
jgi:serine/threonine-protein kinase